MEGVLGAKMREIWPDVGILGAMSSTFSEVTAVLQRDGTLRDFHIFNTTRSDWNAVLRWGSERLTESRFLRDGTPFPLPGSIEEIAEIRNEAALCWQISVAGAYVHCYFFCDEQIELDFWPEDFNTPERWSALCKFFQSIVDLVGKAGVVTYENVEEDVIARFEVG